MNDEELVNLVDHAGKICLWDVPRVYASEYSDSEQPNLYLPIATVVVFHQDEILTHRRPIDSEVDPGKIDHVNGVIRSEETAIQAAIREAAEELGQTLDSITRIRAQVNSYKRYQSLFVGTVLDLNKKDWAFTKGEFPEEYKMGIDEAFSVYRKQPHLFTQDFIWDFNFALSHLVRR